MEITNNVNLESKRNDIVPETAGTIAKAEPKLFERVEDKPEAAGSVGLVETAGTIASAAGAETAGTVASAGGSSSGGSINTVA